MVFIYQLREVGSINSVSRYSRRVVSDDVIVSSFFTEGEQLLEKDEWKNAFLKEITARYGKENAIQFANDDYIIIGLPLYNKDHSKEFDEKFQTLLEK